MSREPLQNDVLPNRSRNECFPMYRMLIVDDDDIERMGIAQLKEWKEIGVQCAGEAWNGEEALRLCGQLSPDIVITDVRTLVMDGITFANRIREQSLSRCATGSMRWCLLSRRLQKRK